MFVENYEFFIPLFFDAAVGGPISISISIYSFKIQLTHRNMITKIKQMIKKKNDKKNRVQQQSQYESLYNILTINKELLM